MVTPKSARFAAIQPASEPGDVAGNLERADRLLRTAAADGAQLVLLPELFNTGYLVDRRVFDLAEPPDGPTVQWMTSRARDLRTIVAGTIAERRDGRLLDTLFVATPEGRVVRYAKRQPTPRESAVFDAGFDAPIAVLDSLRIGLIVCSDTAWGESLLRPLVGQIDVLLVPHATTTLSGVRALRRGGSPAKRRVAVAGALGVPTVMAGVAPQRLAASVASSLSPGLFDLWTTGDTLIADAEGHQLARVEGSEGIAIADVTLAPPRTRIDPAWLRDPGIASKLAACLALPAPNLRPFDPMAR